MHALVPFLAQPKPYSPPTSSHFALFSQFALAQARTYASVMSPRSLVLLLLLGWGTAALAARVPRRLLAAERTSVATIYNEGLLEPGWRSWSWGMSYYNSKAAAQAMPGSRAALCMQVRCVCAAGLAGLVQLRPFAASCFCG